MCIIMIQEITNINYLYYQWIKRETWVKFSCLIIIFYIIFAIGLTTGMVIILGLKYRLQIIR